MQGNAVAVTEEVVGGAKAIDGAVAGSIEVDLVALEEQGSASQPHVLAVAVEVGAFHRAATSHGNAVVALAALTAVVPGHEEVVPAVMLEDERCLDGIGSGIVGGGVLRRIGILGQVSQG